MTVNHTRRRSPVRSAPPERVIDQRTYERQAGKLDEEIALAEMALNDARLDELDVEGILTFAEELIGNAARLWFESSLDQRQRLQKVLFPKGVAYMPDGGFRTAETSEIFRLLQALAGRKEEKVSRVGFEPTTLCLKGASRTTKKIRPDADFLVWLGFPAIRGFCHVRSLSILFDGQLTPELTPELMLFQTVLRLPRPRRFTPPHRPRPGVPPLEPLTHPPRRPRFPRACSVQLGDKPH